MGVKKHIKQKILLTLLPIFLVPMLLIFFIIFALCGEGGSDPLSPPVKEEKAAEYQSICAQLGVPWDIPLLVDTWRAENDKNMELEDLNPLETALEFIVLEEQKFDVSEETTKNEKGEEQIIQHKTLASATDYTGKEEILSYIGWNDEIAQLTVEKLSSKVSEVASGKSNGSVSYEVTFKAVSDVEGILSSVFGFNEEEIKNIMEMHTSRYLILLYNDDSSVSIGHIQIGESSEMEQAVWEFLHTIGFNDIGAAAAMGNIKIESSFNPAANHNNNYFGICQWGGGRWQGNAVSLLSFAGMSGTEWYNLETQLNFFNLECSTSYSNVYMQMKSATDITYATDCFCVFYEGCVGTLGNWANSVINGQPYQCLADRRAYAQAYYKKYAGNVSE